MALKRSNVSNRGQNPQSSFYDGVLFLAQLQCKDSLSKKTLSMDRKDNYRGQWLFQCTYGHVGKYCFETYLKNVNLSLNVPSRGVFKALPTQPYDDHVT